MLRPRGIALGLVLGLAATGVARAERVVAVAPLATLGSEDTSAGSRKIAAQLERAIASLGAKVVTSPQVARAIKRARKPQLAVCDGEAACLAGLGRLVGAEYVIAGQVGGLGESRVVYLSVTDVARREELRSTTLAVGARLDPKSAEAAVVRLLDPRNHRGRLELAIDVEGATVYINGSRVTLANGQIALPVGPQAVRVTHPQYRDFVRFIEVRYAETVEVPVAMTQFPIVERDVLGKPINRDRIEYIDPPVYRRWYVVGPAAVGLAIVTGIVVGVLVHDLPGAPCRKVGGEPC